MTKRLMLACLLFSFCSNESKDSHGICSAAFAVWGFDVPECSGDECIKELEYGNIILIVDPAFANKEHNAATYGFNIIRLGKLDFDTLVHEIGHILHIPHNDSIESIMYPYDDTLRGKIPAADELLFAHLINGKRKLKCEIIYL